MPQVIISIQSLLILPMGGDYQNCSNIFFGRSLPIRGTRASGLHYRINDHLSTDATLKWWAILFKHPPPLDYKYLLGGNQSLMTEKRIQFTYPPRNQYIPSRLSLWVHDVPFPKGGEAGQIPIIFPMLPKQNLGFPVTHSFSTPDCFRKPIICCGKNVPPEFVLLQTLFL